MEKEQEADATSSRPAEGEIPPQKNWYDKLLKIAHRLYPQYQLIVAASLVVAMMIAFALNVYVMAELQTQHKKILSLESSCNCGCGNQQDQEQFNFTEVIHDYVTVMKFNVSISKLTDHFDALNETLKSLANNLTLLLSTKVNQTNFNTLSNTVSSNYASLYSDVTMLNQTKAERTDLDPLWEAVDWLNDTKVNQNEFDSLSTDVQQLDEDKASQELVLDLHSNYTNALERHVTVTEFNKSTSALMHDIETLSKNAASKTELNSLSARVDELASIKANQSDLEVLSSAISHLDTTKASQSDFNELSTAVTVLETTKASQTQLSQLEANVDGLSANINVLDGNIQSLEATTVKKTIFDALRTEVNDLKSKKVNKETFDSLSDRVDSHILTSQDSFRSVNDRLDSLSDTLNTHVQDGTNQERGNYYIIFSCLSFFFIKFILM